MRFIQCYINPLPFLFALLLISKVNFAQAPDLRSTASFALFTAAGAFNNSGTTVVTGDIGTNVGAFSGFPPGIVIGEIHVADPESAQAAADVALVYSDLAGVTCGQVIGSTLGNGQILGPNVYCIGSAATLNADLILDGQGDPNALFIFQINGALSTSTLSNVILINGASICNVYWQINGAFSLGDDSVFRGTVVANGAIALLQASTLIGRGLSTAGAISLFTNVVNVSLEPIPATIVASGATTFCIGDSVTLSGNIDGVWNTGETTPSIIVKTGGDYFVVNTTMCGSDTSNHIIVTVNALPVCTITGENTICQGSSTSLCAPAGHSYLWSTGATTECITVSTAATYSVTITDANGCTSSCSSEVFVNPSPNCTITGDNTICQGSSTSLCAPLVVGNSYAWSNGATTVCITVGTAGIYSVTVTDANGCTSSCNTTLTVNPLPNCTITGSDMICPGSSTTLCVPHVTGNTYIWSTGATTDCITVSAAGTYSVTVTDANDCTNSCSKTVTVNAILTCTITGNTTICEGGSTMLCVPNEEGNSYIWSTGETVNCITVSAAGTYSVTIFEVSGCISICNATVTVSPLPSCTITGDNIICQGSSTSLCAPAEVGHSYVWSTGATTECITVSTADTYSVTITDANGCTNSCSIDVIVNPLPNCTISGDNTICPGSSTTLCVQHVDGNTYQWNTGETLNCITVNVAGTFIVTVTDVNGCTSSCNTTVTIIPTCIITGNNTICPGTSTLLCVPDMIDNTYLWSTGETTRCITVASAGAYSITITNTDCIDSCEITVTTLDSLTSITCPPDATINFDTFDCSRVFCYNVTATGNCPRAFVNLPGYNFIGIYNGNSYFISPPGAANYTDWSTANQIAAEQGGHLVTIEDVLENNFLSSNIPFTDPFLPGNGMESNQYWIGLRYSPKLNQFKWTTEEEFTYSNWGPFQPGIITDDFVWFFDIDVPGFGPGTWYDGDPILPNKRYIIEIEDGLQIKLISGLASGSVFPPGVTTNVYEVTDGDGNTARCSFDVNVIGSSSIQCININLSLTEDCIALVTAEMLLTGEYFCYDIFEVTLSHYGHPIPNPVTREWIGKTIVATVTDPTTGNSCWSYVTIEDKLGPTIVCENDTMSCQSYLISGNRIQIIEECSEYDSILVDEFVQTTPCDSHYIKVITQTWTAIDSWGNVGDTCTRDIWIERIRKDDIFYPGDVDIQCKDVRLDSLGNIDPLLTGFPTLDGISVYPVRDLFCNYYVDYEDIDLGEISCVRKILRTWRLREWWCNTEEIRTVPQWITIKDEYGPEISFRPHDFSATTQHRSCVAVVPIPSIIAHDSCHDILRIDVVYPGGILVGQNGGTVELPVGADTIIYKVYDACYNLTEDTLIITVRDATPPVAVCDRRTVVSLNHAGTNWVPASVFDDGSFDECKVHHFEVRRMDENSCGTIGEDDWGPEVQFCCEDVGNEIMVGFKVIDESGNESVCMVLVEVQDKERPRIICPPDISVECRFDIDFTRLEVFGRIVTQEVDRQPIIIDPIYEHYFSTAHPVDGIAFDNCPPLIIEQIDTSDLDMCGNGVILRTFIVIDGQGLSDTCVQRIEIFNDGIFTESDIAWPEDFDTTEICDSRLLIPELLRDSIIKQPYFTDDECSLIGLTYKDKIFSSTLLGEPCYKIFRTWKVIDWCFRDRSGDPLIFEHEQIIRVYNEVAPIIDSLASHCRDTLICSYDINCQPIQVEFRAEATDECTATEELLWRYKIDFDSDGTFDVNQAAINGNVATGTWPLGKHIFKWEVEDRCGNVDVCQFNLELRNCKAPVAYCLYGLAISLTPMDTTGDGIPDTEMATIWASDFDGGSNHNCGYPIVLSFSSDTSDKSRTYDCDDIGRNDVEMWVTDINGNTSFCRTYVLVQDSNQVDICPPTAQEVTIDGIIQTYQSNKIENATVELKQSQQSNVLSDFDGKFSFQKMQKGGSYIIQPKKNEEWLNGVTTADIVKIQRHILGQQIFSSGYEMIAADVNKSQHITAKDMSDLRKLILGIITEIPENESWRFIDAGYKFQSVEKALEETIPEEYTVQQLVSDMHVNFTGIKIGDLNGSVRSRGVNGGIKVREGKSLKLYSEDQRMEVGRIYAIDVKGGENMEEYSGMQFTIEFDPSKLEMIEVMGDQGVKFGGQNYSLKNAAQGILTVSWDGEAQSSDKLFTLMVKSLARNSVSEVLSLSNRITPVLGVLRESGEESGIQWQIGNRVEEGMSFAVSQNEPNPWNGETSINITLPKSGEVRMSIYDAKGKMYYQTNEEFKKGVNEWKLNREILPQSGMYFFQVDYGNETMTKRMVIMN